MKDQVEDIIHHTITEATSKMAASDVVRSVSAASGLTSRAVRDAIHALVNKGEIRYTYVHGTSFLEKSFDRPVRVSDRIIIKPPAIPYDQKAEEIVVDMTGEAAFGDGSHPSTCLALRAIDAVLSGRLSAGGKIPSRALDVGTGTGILAIALAKLGVQDVTATDIDPCARVEAARNAEVNGVSGRLTVSGAPAEAAGGPFGLIAANLASPTLKALSPALSQNMETPGILILSGFKAPAAEDLKGAYHRLGFQLIREEALRRWVGLAFRRKSSP